MVKKYDITLNADVGEEAGFDKEIMPYISWCNIACGAHAGDEKVIQETIKLAKKFQVKIGAHPSYPDRDNFGRKSMDISMPELYESIVTQISKIKKYADKERVELHHIKPHGALYNDAVVNPEIANTIIRAIKNNDKSTILIVPPNSKIKEIAQHTLKIKEEVFADRNYNKDYTLVSRKFKNAVITDPKVVFEHVYKMIKYNQLRTIDDHEIPIIFNTICVHGDNPESLSILKYLVKELKKNAIKLK